MEHRLESDSNPRGRCPAVVDYVGIRQTEENSTIQVKFPSNGRKLSDWREQNNTLDLWLIRSVHILYPI